MGRTKLNYDPGEVGRRVPLQDWLAMMGKTAHLTRPEYAPDLETIEGGRAPLAASEGDERPPNPVSG